MEYTSEYGLSLLRKLDLYGKLGISQKKRFEESWSWIIKKHEGNPIEATIDLYGSILLLMESFGEREKTQKIRTRTAEIEDKIIAMEIREKFEAGSLDKELDF